MRRDEFDNVPDAVDPGDPQYRSPDNEEYESAGEAPIRPRGEEEPAEAEAVSEEEEEFPEGTTILYDEDGNAFLGIPIDPDSIPDMEDNDGQEAQ